MKCDSGRNCYRSYDAAEAAMPYVVDNIFSGPAKIIDDCPCGWTHLVPEGNRHFTRAPYVYPDKAWRPGTNWKPGQY